MVEEKKPRNQSTTRKGRAEASAKKAADPPAHALAQKERFAEVHSDGPLSKPSIKSLGKRIRETTEDGRFVYEVLRDILLDTAEHASDRIAAGKVLLERGWGKVPDVVILEEIINPSTTLRQFSTDELKRLLVVAVTQEVVEGEVKELDADR